MVVIMPHALRKGGQLNLVATINDVCTGGLTCSCHFFIINYFKYLCGGHTGVKSYVGVIHGLLTKYLFVYDFNDTPRRIRLLCFHFLVLVC